MNKKILTIIVSGIISVSAFCQDEIFRTFDLFMLQKQYEQALKEIRRVIKEYPENHKAFYLMGMVESELQHYKIALGAYAKCSQLDTANRVYLNALASTYHSLGNLPNAKKLYAKTLERDSTDRTALVQLAKLREKDKEYKDAIPLWHTLQDMEPENFIYYRWLGNDYLQFGETDKSIVQYRKAIELNRQDLISIHNLSHVYLKRKEFEKGLAVVDEALEIYPDVMELIQRKGQFLYHLKHYKEAIPNFEQAALMGTPSLSTYKYLGYSYFQIDSFKMAEKYLTLVTQVDPKDFESFIYLGISYRENGDYENSYYAFYEANEILKPSPKSQAMVHYEMAETYLKQDELEMALAMLKKAYQSYPEDLLIIYKMAHLYDTQLNDLRMAKQYYSDFMTMVSAKEQMGEYSGFYEKAYNRVRFLNQELHFSEE